MRFRYHPGPLNAEGDPDFERVPCPHCLAKIGQGCLTFPGFNPTIHWKRIGAYVRANP
jgi:hypothetical protein